MNIQFSDVQKVFTSSLSHNQVVDTATLFSPSTASTQHNQTTNYGEETKTNYNNRTDEVRHLWWIIWNGLEGNVYMSILAHTNFWHTAQILLRIAVQPCLLIYCCCFIILFIKCDCLVCSIVHKIAFVFVNAILLIFMQYVWIFIYYCVIFIFLLYVWWLLVSAFVSAWNQLTTHVLCIFYIWMWQDY